MSIPRLLSVVASGLLGLAVSASPASAADPACSPQVRDGWVRLGPGGMPMMAGFGRIENRCSAAATITGASSPAFGSAELHETRMVDGVNRMRPLPALRIPAGGDATLAPGGMHLMLMRPRVPLQAGSRVKVSFALSGGGEAVGEFEVRKPDAL